MKKMMIALAAAAAIAAGSMSVSAESLWKYNDTITIDMQETSIKKTTNGHEILNFVAVEAIEGGTCTYTYAYDRTAGTPGRRNGKGNEEAPLQEQLHSDLRQFFEPGHPCPCPDGRRRISEKSRT